MTDSGETGRFMVVPAAYVIFRRGDEILLQLRQNTGYRDDHWALGAAGHVEADESLFTAACREAYEELGVLVTEADLEPVCTLHRTSTGVDQRRSAIDERVDFFVSTRIWSGVPTRREPEKCADLRWFALDALPDPVVPHELTVLQAVREAEATGARVPAIMSSGWA